MFNKKNINAPKIGFCIFQHPVEVGSENSEKYLDLIKKVFPQDSISFIVFNKVIDDDICSKEAGLYFRENDIDVLIAVYASWSNDFHLVDMLEYADVPLVLWALPGMETGSLCGIHQLGVVLFELKKKYKIFYGKLEDENLHYKILSFCRAAALKRYLRRLKIGFIGYRVHGMTEVAFDELELKSKFGPRVVHYGVEKLVEKTLQINIEDARSEWNSIKKVIKKISVPDSYGIEACRKYLAFKKIAEEDNLCAFAVECYPDLMGQVCLPASMLAEKDDIVFSCEGDVNSAVAMIMLNYLTGEPVHNTDLLDPDSENSVVFSHCGSGAFCIAKDRSCIELCQVRLKDNGVCVIFLPKLGDITLVNIVGRKDTYRISAIEGYSKETEMVFPGNPVSASFNISAGKLLELIAENAIGHHWMIGYGKVLRELKYFSELANIKFIDLE